MFILCLGGLGKGTIIPFYMRYIITRFYDVTNIALEFFLVSNALWLFLIDFGDNAGRGEFILRNIIYFSPSTIRAYFIVL